MHALSILQVIKAGVEARPWNEAKKLPAAPSKPILLLLSKSLQYVSYACSVLYIPISYCTRSFQLILRSFCMHLHVKLLCLKKFNMHV